jgi:hypothetical protein
MHRKFWSENLKGRDHSEDLGIDVKLYRIKLDTRKIWWKGMDWMHLAQDREQRRALNLLVP